MNKTALELENKKELNSSQIFSIAQFALLGSTVQGVFYEPIYERALYTFACLAAYPELADESITAMAGSNVLAAWDYLVENKYIEKVEKEFPASMKILMKEAPKFAESYVRTMNSIRGVLLDLNMNGAELVGKAEEALQKTLSSEDIQNIEKITEKWQLA